MGALRSFAGALVGGRLVELGAGGRVGIDGLLVRDSIVNRRNCLLIDLPFVRFVRRLSLVSWALRSAKLRRRASRLVVSRLRLVGGRGVIGVGGVIDLGLRGVIRVLLGGKEVTWPGPLLCY